GSATLHPFSAHVGQVVALFLPAPLLAAQGSSSVPPGSWNDQGVIYLDRSLNARVHTVPLRAVHMGDGFWSARRKVTTEKSLPTFLLELEDHGVVDNFRRLAG